jgi:hypothetical protein
VRGSGFPGVRGSVLGARWLSLLALSSESLYMLGARRNRRVGFAFAMCIARVLRHGGARGRSRSLERGGWPFPHCCCPPLLLPPSAPAPSAPARLVARHSRLAVANAGGSIGRQWAAEVAVD